MTDTIAATLAISAGVLPTVTVLVGILLNRNDTTWLDARISALEVSLRGDMAAFRGELAATRAQFHSDVLMLLGSDKEQDARITRLEARA